MINYLKSTIQKFEDYRKILLNKDSKNEYLDSITYEAIEKLHQIDYLFKKQQQLEYCIKKNTLIFTLQREGLMSNNYNDKIPSTLFEDELEYSCLVRGKNNQSILREIITYTESIYYFTFSFAKKCDSIPGLKQFTPTGIRNVRNHIMEHPKEKWSNAFAIADSIILKTGKYSFSKSEDKWVHEDISVDKGLKTNMEEFKSKLENLLELRIQGK